MKQPKKILMIALSLGLLGAFAQVWFIRSTAAYAPLVRGVTFIAIPVFIGLFAALTERKDTIKTAALGGFTVGFIQSWSTVFFSLDRQAFQSVEVAFARIGAIFVALALTSWLTAGLASVVAFPITQAFSEKGEIHEANYN